jgi:HlyD family secretion protein
MRVFRPLNRPQAIGLGLALAALLLGAWLLTPQPLSVETAVIHKGAIADAVADQGVMRVREAFVVAAPVAGRLERVRFKVGDRVAKDDAVARIRPLAADFLDPRSQAQARAAIAVAQAALAAAQAEVRSAAARRELADRDFARTQSLATRGIASKQALESAQLDVNTARSAEQAARARVRAHEADVTAARAALMGPTFQAGAALTVTAPTSGVVTRVFQESERTLASGSPILEIGDRGGLEAAIEFLSQDAVRIREGQAAEVFDWGGAPLAAVVRRVEPQAFTKVSALGVEEQRVLVLLQISAPPDQWLGLGAGYRIWGRVFLRKAPQATLAPLGALVRSGRQWAVFAVINGRARLRPVTTGAMDDRNVEVKEGLQPGGTVIVFPSDRVRDGVRVRTTRRDGPKNS